MKTKNVTLGIFALVFAIGSAVASSFIAAIPVYLRLDKTNDGIVNPTCEPTSFTCESTGDKVCKFEVQLTNPDGTAGPTVLVPGRTATVCNVIPKDNRIAPPIFNPSFPIYNAQ